MSTTSGWRLRITQSLALIWLLDGLLQLQPYMFTAKFANDTLRSASVGSPAWITGPADWSAKLTQHHAVLSNLLFVGIQLGIGAAMLFSRTRKAAFGVSIVWALLVWWLGEGLGGLFAGPVGPAAGAPGAVVLYALITLIIWPSNNAHSGRFTSRLATEAFARVSWLILWTLFAVEGIQGSNRSPSGLHDLIVNAESGEPGWIKAIDNFGARLVGSHGTTVSLVSCALFVVIGLGVRAPLRLRRALICVSIAVAALMWIFVQNFGGIATGQATDPNSAPLLVLFALCFWSARGTNVARESRISTSNPNIAP